MSEWQTLALNKLDQFAKSSAITFQSASPFPHIVIDNFLSLEIVEALLEEFPNDSDPIWEASDQKVFRLSCVVTGSQSQTFDPKHDLSFIS